MIVVLDRERLEPSLVQRAGTRETRNRRGMIGNYYLLAFLSIEMTPDPFSF
jgi:hypothetical protein